MSLEAKLNRSWYEQAPVPAWTIPLSLLFRVIVALRRSLYRLGALRARRMPVPVVVVGNITAGGTGKSPLTIALVELLGERNLRCGIVSRGYGGAPGRVPLLVTADSDVAHAGDEALMMAHRTGMPVCVHPRRALATERLLAENTPDVVICDDGLQHYALARDVEIAVVDAGRGLGNGRMLPAGPLREPAARLNDVDHVVLNGDGELHDLPVRLARMRLEPRALVNVGSGERREADALNAERCVAVAGIGNPQRFFASLSQLGYSAECRAFPDHHSFTADDLAFSGERPVLMTEKDAVKCRAFARSNWWYLEVGAVLDREFAESFVQRVERLVREGRGRRERDRQHTA